MRDLAGQTFGSYLLEEPLGSGGMGEVYAARHVRLTKRRAAVKVLPSSLATEPEFRRRFEAEANAAASLDHPNILGLWEFGEHEGMPYLAMPLILGGSLKELLERRSPLSIPEASRIVTQIGAALDYAHGRGVLHRDVKPANILLTEEGRPVLADFGIAKVMEASQTQITRAGTGIGTPEYMAPEQLEGRAERRSDLYALGVVLYQMLTGKVPYSGSTPYAVAYQQLEAPLPPLRAANPRVPLAVERVLERALAKDPAQRYATGKELAAAFEAASTASPHDQRTGPLIMTPAPATALAPVERRPQSVPAAAPLPAYVPLPATETPPPRQSNPWPLAVAALLALVLLFGGALAYLTLNRAAPPAAAATATTAPPDFAATGTALAVNVGADIAARATRTADALALQGAIAAGTSTAQAGLQATATSAAQANAASTATAGAAGATEQALVAATGTAQVQATQQAGAMTATSAAAIGATQTASGNATATVLARPSPTPVPPTAPPPTATPPPAPTAPPAAWGPVLAPLAGGQTYTDPQQRFSLSVPRDWTAKTNPDSSVTFSTPGNTAVAGVLVDDLSRAPNTTLEQYAKLVEDQLKKQTDYQQLSLDRVLLGNQQALRRVFRVRSSNGTVVQAEQLYVVANGLGHRLTFETLPNNFSAQQQTFDAVAGSYRTLK